MDTISGHLPPAEMQMAQVAGNCEQIDALPIVASPVALRVRAGPPLHDNGQAFHPVVTEFTSPSGREPDVGRDDEAARQRFP